MFPFDLKGPLFLGFYWSVAALALVLVFAWRNRKESAAAHPIELLSDPYLLAYLRADGAEVLRVALVGLISEGAVKVVRNYLQAVAGDARLTRPPIETELLAALRKRRSFDNLRARRVGASVCEQLRQRLETLGYLHDRWHRRKNALPRQVAMLVLGSLAGIKVVVALRSGHTNVGLLIVSAVIALVWLSKLRPLPGTARGRAALESARDLLQLNRDRIASDPEAARGTELALVTAVFGIPLLEKRHYPFVSALSALRSSGPGRARSTGGLDWSFVGGGFDIGSTGGGGFDGGSTGGGGFDGGNSCGGGGGGGCGGCGS